MKHEMQTRYPAPATAVVKMFADRDFHVRRLEALGYAGKYRVLAHRFDGKDFSIRIERKVPVQMPGVKKAAGETTVVNEETWNLRSKTGKVTVEAQGMPLSMSCETAIRDEGDACVVNYRWDVRARIPLVGGALEKFAIADMERRAAEETRVGIELLADYR
ncbi:MAG: DUF2505 domain-containing protein [Sinobacteraceae bacterium]|nr:DUF2505 domain-containing protein [Nevskiaceae bacterium]